MKILFGLTQTQSKDELSGIWLRVYSGSEWINEFAQPSSLTQEKWDGQTGGRGSPNDRTS
jgi:hypothetical protein